MEKKNNLEFDFQIVEVYSKPTDVLEVKKGVYEENNGAAMLFTSYLMCILGINLRKKDYSYYV